MQNGTIIQSGAYKRSNRGAQAEPGFETVGSSKIFLDEVIPDHLLQEIVDAAMQAPIYGDSESYELYSITARNRIDSVMATISGQRHISNASALMAFCYRSGRRERRYPVHDMRSLWLENVSSPIAWAQVASNRHGIGCVQLFSFSENSTAKAMDLQRGVWPIAIVALGYLVPKLS